MNIYITALTEDHAEFTIDGYDYKADHVDTGFDKEIEALRNSTYTTFERVGFDGDRDVEHKIDLWEEMDTDQENEQYISHIEHNVKYYGVQWINKHLTAV